MEAHAINVEYQAFQGEEGLGAMPGHQVLGVHETWKYMKHKCKILCGQSCTRKLFPLL
jgi:hypothetical protein